VVVVVAGQGGGGLVPFEPLDNLCSWHLMVIQHCRRN